MKRRFIVGIISFVLVLFSALNVKAVNNTVYLNVVKNTDNTVVATLTVDVLDKGLDALSGKINYDKEKLEFVKIETGNEKWNKPSYNNENGKFTLLINSETITEKNEAIVITFKVKENVTGDVTISIVDLVGATSEDKKINWDGLTATVNVDGDNNEQNGNNNEGNNENNDGNNTENNSENDNIGNGGNNSEENGNNNGNINNDNNGEHVQNNESNDSNNGNIENNNIGNNNNDSENDVNNTDKKPSKNEENLAPGKLPQTGNNLFMYIINMAVFLIVAILIVLYIRSKINKEK
jgi:probable serine/threonine-protein kinase roco9